jgi:hypothetical protein
MIKNKLVWLFIVISITYILLAIYLFRIIFFINEVLIYPDEQIPVKCKGYAYYFHEQKMRLKSIIIVLFLISYTITFLYLWIKSKSFYEHLILVIQVLLVIAALLYSLRFPIFVT